MARRGRFRSFMVLVAVLLVAGGLSFVFLSAFRAGPPPRITVVSELPAIGSRTPVQVKVEESKRGLTRLRVELVQGENVQLLDERTYTPREPWRFWGELVPREELVAVVGKETVKSLREGKATVRVTADRAPSWLRSPQPAVEELTLEVKLRPPQLQILSTHTYVAQGGCETVVYRVSKDSVRDGVQAGDRWFPGYPLPGGDDLERFAFFAAPYDLDDHRQINLVAVDVVDNEARQAFIDRFNAKPPKSDKIHLSDSFMGRVVPAILDQTPQLEDQGDLLKNYLMINGELRAVNDRTLREMAERSEPRFLWSREFKQMKNAQVMSTFADRRTYVYDGRDVDHQDHLGFDLASTRRAPIEASNSGIVVLAGYFGIYGNAVVIDHGYGLASLYGHLSEVSTTEGQQVERGEVIGRSGQSGLAGGDHLHYTILLQGLPVNPREWWDAHWIHDRLKLKLEDALPFEG